MMMIKALTNMFPIQVPNIATSILLACLTLWIFWKAYRTRLHFSALDNVAGPPAASFLRGNFTRFFSNNTRDYQIQLLEKYGQVIKLKFYFGESVLVVSDPKALHHMVMKDHIYQELPTFLITHRVLFGPGLTASVGEQHRKQRKILNPVFATSRLKEMVPIFYDVVYTLRDTITNQVREGPKEIELMEWMSRTSLEMIGQSGFGYSFDGLAEDSIPHPFAAAARRFDAVSRRLAFVRLYLLPTLYKIGTSQLQSFVTRHLPWSVIQETIQMLDKIDDTSVDIVESRKKTLSQGKEAMDRQVGGGKDMLSILLRANEEAGVRDKLSDEEVKAQISTFTFAAMDTTSSALARTLWVLAQRQDAQDKLRLEIRKAREGKGDLTHDELMNLPYLDAICKETLRLYPPVAALARVTGEDVVLPLRTPIKGVDGTQITEIGIPKGTKTFINVAACNNNPEIWGEDSYEWKPERWLQPLPDSVASARIPGIFSNMMTFIGGGRSCIGVKFAQLEMHVVLLLMIESFKFTLPLDKEIEWQTQAITKPSVVGSPEYQLPLVVENVV